MDLSLLDSSLIDVHKMSNLSDFFFMKACTIKSPERYFRFSEWPAWKMTTLSDISQCSLVKVD
jgi:hypothetical protein